MNVPQSDRAGNNEPPQRLNDFSDAIANLGRSGARAERPHETRTDPEAASGADEAIDFLRHLDPDGRHNLVAMQHAPGDEKPTIVGASFEPESWPEIRSWITRHYRNWNQYFSVNEPVPHAPNKKLDSSQIARIRGVAADKDPEDSEPPYSSEKSARARDLALSVVQDLKTGSAPPTIMVDSGGGAQGFWLLAEKLDTTEANLTLASSIGRSIADQIGGDSVSDLPRIMRLPGTVNHPNPKKVQRGRICRPTKVLDRTERRYSLSELAASFPPKGSSIVANPQGVKQAITALREADLFEVPSETLARFEDALQRDEKLAALWRGEHRGLVGSNSTGSGYRASLAIRLAEHGFGLIDYAQLACSWTIDQIDQAKIEPTTAAGLRQLARDWKRLAEPRSVERWFELADVNDPTAQAFVGSSGNALSNSPGAPRFDFAKATTLAASDFDNIPPKEFLLGTRFQPASYTVGLGPGGVSKSMFAMLSAVSIAVGRPLTGELVSTSGPVLIYDAETPAFEMRRRLRALVARHNVTPEDVISSVHLLSGEDLRFVLAERREKGGPITPGPHVEGLRQFIASKGLIHVVLDPFISLHRGLDENSADDMDGAVDIVRALAANTGAHFEVIHHTVKNRNGHPEANAGNAEASRGSGATIMASRSAYTLSPMSTTRGAELGLDPDRVTQMVRVDDAKRNNTRRSAKVHWFEIESVLPNGEVVPGWHFDAADPALRERALQTVGVHVRFDEHHQRTLTALRTADSLAQRRAALLTFLVGAMAQDRTGRTQLVNSLMDARGVSETTARTELDDAIPDGKTNAVEAAGDGVRYRVWREKLRTGRQRSWTIFRQPIGQIVPDAAAQAGEGEHWLAADDPIDGVFG